MLGMIIALFILRYVLLLPHVVVGADNAYVVCEILGYSAEELTAWQTQGVIKDYT